MKRLIAAVLPVLLLSCAACGSREHTAPNTEASAGLFAMDTYLNLTAYGESAEGRWNRHRSVSGNWRASGR